MYIYNAVSSQTAVTFYLISNQLLPFSFVEQHNYLVR